MRRFASMTLALVLALAAVACSRDTTEPPPPSIGLTPGPAVSLLAPQTTGAPVPRAEPGDGSPPIVFGDCVVETGRRGDGPVQFVDYGEISCAEAAKRKPDAWKVVDMTDGYRAPDCPEDGRHIDFTISPLLSASSSNSTNVCAEQL